MRPRRAAGVSAWKSSSSSVAQVAGLLVEGCAVLVVTYGAIEAFVQLLGLAIRPAAGHGARKEIWRRFGIWLLLGLEFELAADIIGSVISPTWQDIGELGAIAVIRTFLNYFLEKDLEKPRSTRPEAWPTSPPRSSDKLPRSQPAGAGPHPPRPRADADGLGPHGHLAHLVRLHHLQDLRAAAKQQKAPVAG